MFGSHTQRIVTGLVLLAIVGFVGWLDNLFVMWLFFGAVYILAFKEALALYGLKTKNYFFAIVLWLIAGVYPYGDDLFILAGVVYASAVAYNKNLSWKNFLPYIYPTAGMLYIFTMYKEYGVISLFWLLAVVALTDIGAYAVGKSIGKTKFCETSPNKTMEGVVGGIVVATIGGMSLGVTTVDLFAAFMISFATSVASVFGDLYESKLKREAGVKDSGDLLPGHGGVLDRIDGYLFGGIVMLILLRGLV